MTNEQKNYYRELSRVQNRLSTPMDIITITGFMNWEEKLGQKYS